MKGGRATLWFAAGALLTTVCFLSLLFIGSIYIPADEVWNILGGGLPEKGYWKTIVLESRLPMAICAAACGSGLSVAGLVMQTVFRNPLAGPSVLGVSSGASLGVAVIVLGGVSILPSVFAETGIIFGAIVGAAATIGILIMFSALMKNGVVLLIVGIMISYLCTALISLLNYFSPAEEIRSYLFWGLGSYSGLQLDSSLWLLCLTAVILFFSFLYIKPLNALLLGERYTESLGYSVGRLRIGLLTVSGLLVAVATAFCGPIGFIGLIVPHLCRLLMQTSNHRLLLPGSILFGAFVSLLCALVGVLPSEKFGVLPINVVTPLIGVPVIIYLLVNRKRIVYFR